MARDYAARGRSRPRSSRKTSGAGLPGWVWLVAGVAIGLSVAAFLYIRRPVETALRGTTAAVGTTGAAKSDGIAIPPREKPRFSFYEMLPRQKVAIPDEAPPAKGPPAGQAPSGSAAAAATAPTTAPAGKPVAAAPAATAPSVPAAVPGESYLVQVAAYRSAEEANRHKAELALIGLQANVAKVTLDNREVWYRVRVGPEPTAARAQAVIAQLQSNGMEGILVKVR